MNLTDYIRKVSKEDFQRDFKHEAVWNSRLRTTGGRFFPKDGHLDFNPKIHKEFGWEIFRKIVRHELCHYHLYFEKKGYQHKDRDFRELLSQVDGLRYAPNLEKSTIFKIYQCQSCGQIFSRKRLINTDKYRCGKCRGELVLFLNQDGKNDQIK